jgi:hypothetical protein
MMPQGAQPQDEPDWVKRLRARGFDVQGGEGNLPEEPEASFAPMPQRSIPRMLRAVLRWLRVRERTLPGGRRHAPVP